MSVILGQFFWSICTNAGDQVVLQRYLSTPSLASARKSVWVFTVLQIHPRVRASRSCGLALFASIGTLPGSRPQEFQNQIAPQADRLLPRFIAEGLPVGLLRIAPRIAPRGRDGQPQLGDQLHLHGHDRRPRSCPQSRRGAASEVRLEKAISLVAGVFGLAMACAVAAMATSTSWNLLELSLRVGHLFVGPVAILFFAGILFRRVGTAAALWGFSLGTALSIYICFGKEIFGLEKSISFTWIVTLPFLTGLTTAALLGPWLASPTPQQIRGLTLRGLADEKPRRAPATELEQPS